MKSASMVIETLGELYHNGQLLGTLVVVRHYHLTKPTAVAYGYRDKKDYVFTEPSWQSPGSVVNHLLGK